MDTKTRLKTYSAPISKLEDNEVFVFGANIDGFHGAGSAGYASFGVSGNVWRNHAYGSKPNGWKGKWAVKGELGLQEGTEGKSYALPTVISPGARRSLVPNFRPLFESCREHSSWKFYLAQGGVTGLNGWSPAEMASFVHAAGEIPPNLYFEESFAQYL